LFRWLPGLQAVRSYRREWLPRNIIAGVVLTTLLVPQGMTKITMHFPYQRMRRAGAIERDHGRLGQPRSGDRTQYRAARRANRNSGLILLRSGRTSHGVLAVIVTQR